MTLAIIAYSLSGASIIAQIIGIIRKHRTIDLLINILNTAAATALLILLIMRSIKISFPALTGTYESLIFYSCCIFILASVYGFQSKITLFPAVRFFATAVALAFILIASSPLVSSELNPPIPALQSGWLVLHVALSFIGESFFAVSFVAAILSVSSRNTEKIKAYDRLTHSAIIAGYPIFTIGALIFGAIWAEAAWGRFWSWDPKETWALITWLVYSLYLHFRLFRKSSPKLCAWLAIAGFASTLFTFFGVNYLLPGLHSYG